MAEPMVSVIIPTYARPQKLQQAVDSVLNQTYTNIEVIVVDDNNNGSEARLLTEQLMEKYAEESKVIYLKHEKNKNGAAARNTGLSAAKGKYVSFLDDDDEMLPNRIQILCDAMENLSDEWVACYSDFIKLKPNGIEERCGENRTGDLYLPALMRSLYFCPGSNLFARLKNVKDIGGFDTDFMRNQDMEFAVRLLENKKLYYVDEVSLIIHYENHEGKPFTYEKLVSIDELFLSKFEGRIQQLPQKDQKRIYQHFALERFRHSIKRGKIFDSLKNCVKNKVSLWLFIRYIIYMFKRVISKKSFGFNI